MFSMKISKETNMYMWPIRSIDPLSFYTGLWTIYLNLDCDLRERFEGTVNI